MELVADFGATKQIRVVMLARVNATAATTARVRLSTSDATGAAGDAYDSGSLTLSSWDASYPHFVHLFAAVSGRYLRVDLSGGGVSFYQAGRWFAGDAFQPATNVQFGFRRGIVDSSRIEETAGGQQFVDRRARRRRFVVTYDFLSDAEMQAGLLEIDRLAGPTEDVFFTIDPDSANLGRDSLVGLISRQSGITNQFANIHQQSYTITERL